MSCSIPGVGPRCVRASVFRKRRRDVDLEGQGETQHQMLTPIVTRVFLGRGLRDRGDLPDG